MWYKVILSPLGETKRDGTFIEKLKIPQAWDSGGGIPGLVLPTQRSIRTDLSRLS